MKTSKILLFLFLAIFATSNLKAAKVTPVRFDMSVAPGQSREFSINLTGSKGEYSQNLLLYTSDLSMARNGALGFERRESERSAVKWIKLETERVTLFENQSRSVNFKVSIPSNAIPGEYYCIIMVEPEKFTKVKDKNNPVMLQMKTRVAVVVVLDVPGRVYEKKGEVTEINVLETENLVKVSSSFKNLGDMHLDVVGEAVVRSADGKINFGNFMLKAEGGSRPETFILPNTIRDFEGSLERLLPSGDYQVDISYNYGYDFKKATMTQGFTVTRKNSIKEDESQFLVLGTESLKLQIPEGARRTEVVKLTNTDYRPLTVDISSDSDLTVVNPSKLVLRPGEVRNILTTVSVKKYDGDEKESTIIFKTDRGRTSKIKVLAFKNKKDTEP